MPNFMWMSIENAIEVWMNGEEINYILKHALEEPIAHLMEQQLRLLGSLPS